MTFTELVSAVQERLNLTSTESATRIGGRINDRYRRVTSSIGINLSRRATFQQNASIGISTITFTTCEKLINVVDRSATPYRVLEEVTVEQLRSNQPSSSSTPRKYAIILVDAHAVTIELDCIPQTGFTLYADGYNRATTLSGSQEPAFEEDFHDILYHGALADEYRKVQMKDLAREAEQMYENRLSDLRMFRAKSSYLDIMQNGNQQRSVGPTGGSGGSGTSTSGSSSYTQTGLITFDRTSATVGSRYPFAVAAGSEKVANLDADKLDGLDSTVFVRTDAAATRTAGTLRQNTNVSTEFGSSGQATLVHDGTDLLLNAQANGTGKFRIPSGQITFPSAQNSSTDVNTLDDYEEGTFTPTITSTGGGTPTYSVQVGAYTKIGREVFVHGRVTMATKGTLAVGQVGIGNFPFTSLNTTNLYAVGSVVVISGMTTSIVSLSAYMQPNTTALLLAHMTAAATAVTSTLVADVSATVDFVFSVRFITT